MSSGYQTKGKGSIRTGGNFTASVIQYVDETHNLMITSEEKLRIRLMVHLNRLGKQYLWIAPTGILITVLLAFVTTEFKTVKLGDVVFDAATTRSFFMFVLIGSAIWLIYAIKQASRSVSVDELIYEIRKDSKSLQLTDRTK